MADGGSNLKNPSRRKPRLNPQHDAEKHIQCKTDKAGLREVFVSSYKGRGVFASVPFSKGDFVLEYKGKLLSLDNSATNTYNSTEATFLFDFQWKGKYFCIDASLEDQSLGRLVNDEHIIPNCKMRTIALNGMPHLCLFAIRDIMAGEEVTYNYGDSDWPWRKQVHSCPVTTPSLDEDVDSSHQSLLPSECVEPSPYNGNTVHSCPVTTPSLDEDVDSSHQSLLPSECVEPSPYNGNTVHSCPVTTPSLDEDMDSSHQSLLPSECVEPSPYNGNTSLKCSTLNSGKKQTQIERRRAFLLHQRALLDQRLEELDNSKEDTSAESMDESSDTDYSDADYIRDSTGTGSDDSTFLSSENKLRTLRLLQLMPVDNSSKKESSSALSQNKDCSTEEDNTGRKYRPTGKRTISQKRKRNTSLRHKKVNSSISPETAEPSIQIMCTSNDEDHHVEFGIGGGTNIYIHTYHTYINVNFPEDSRSSRT